VAATAVTPPWGRPASTAAAVTAGSSPGGTVAVLRSAATTYVEATAERQPGGRNMLAVGQTREGDGDWSAADTVTEAANAAAAAAAAEEAEARSGRPPCTLDLDSDWGRCSSEQTEGRVWPERLRVAAAEQATTLERPAARPRPG
jgi:hypothetical protein